MSAALFDSFLSTPEMGAVFDDAAIIGAMFRFEAALARAQADAGMLPADAADTIASACDAGLYDHAALLTAGRRAGSLAIPLVKELTRAVALRDETAARHVHAGSTSQDVIDTAMVLVTRDALALIDASLARLSDRLLALAGQHADTPVLARTLMQPAQVTSLGFKFYGWAAPLLRARRQIQAAADRALQLQLGGAVGSLSAMDGKGGFVARRMADQLGLRCPEMAWHTQRDEWVRLGMELAVLTGSLGKIAVDLSLMGQAEVGELAEPSGAGRGGSSAMPHKRNPVGAMVALAAASRAPFTAGALLGTMAQQHERGLGNWQAELAEWPSLFLSAHGALAALDEAIGGLTVDTGRMRANIDALHGLAFAERLAAWLTRFIGRQEAHELVEGLSREVMASGRDLAAVASDAIGSDARLQGRIDHAEWAELFDARAAAVPAATLCRELLAGAAP